MTLLLVAVQTATVGVIATVTIDLWAWLLSRLFGMASLDYAMVGRWLGNMPRGRFAHPSIAHATPVAGERALGWFAHYAIGVAFAAGLVTLTGPGWLHTPTILPALAFGIVTVVVPFFVMQPAFGAGIAASNTPTPTRMRLRSLMTHGVFGIGLYLGARLVATMAGN
ncbi:membrane protein [Pandoraea pneumonica]|jgi:hypothetical protein|uniref:Membrane protein n=1 Tax=Pandoraea pneumonica TaxID=2508299 RepID=A0A5E4RZV4_9BURK|nr:DUF2938 domain-containing protein [Pandoraea pneumonica]VVD68990.1 membrane protein [Pandoraea pneumonica]